MKEKRRLPFSPLNHKESNEEEERRSGEWENDLTVEREIGERAKLRVLQKRKMRRKMRNLK